MPKIREKNLVELAKVVGWEGLTLQAISRGLHYIDEVSCNYGLTPRQEKREQKLEAEATAIAKKHGLIAYHQSDPRGWSLYLVDPAKLSEPIEAVYSQGIAVCPF